MLLQLVRFTLLPSLTLAAPAVAQLRQHVSNAGASRQYLSYMMSTQSASLPKKRHEICWIILWHKNFTVANKPAVTGLDDIIQGTATTMLYDFDDSQLEQLTRGIEAPICEFAFIRLSPVAPLSDPGLRTSMHKTYTDCYKMQGFISGQWAYSIDANHPDGIPLSDNTLLKPDDRRLALYFLGWESIELHQDACLTPLFAEEIDKLQPWFYPGSGAWYNTFRQYD
ncbi:hypothetical protein TSTA_098820 [Talaromyces stipitatus ATCC 10500]|uniref:Uncharacterized protein n=1 Tax=Talaromyces stipitatus (strain ATCC 10500 / CBS 375.48 / QM 6759 / NRRL 1006) TaxID=441959 RepID=B8MLQ3_TALSN|nr:uncharacterized protein TSTA_098820 [Talaromyces stipitatus ATCC 10500]EED13625.1 hypothetical protein TSTA_098820 [Talaromyces stipitatus ATCC 10500]